MSDDSTRFWVAFNLVKGIGAVRMRLLLDHFGDAQTAWEAGAQELAAVGLNSRLVDSILAVQRSGQPERAWEAIQSQGMDVLTWNDPRYPRRLLEVDQAPPVLYVRGAITREDEWAVAIVGTRRATTYGRQVAEELAAGLARRGVCIVSGLARGIDAIAHHAALRNGGRTLAVMGSGVDQIYPPEHKRLAQDIIAAGALVSDYPPGAAPEATNFPPRNRIISGLSLAVIVVEAGEKSGALITAAFAAEQGRPVLAVPGSIYALQSKGPNRLIQEGAQALLGVQDVLELLNLTQVEQQRQARLILPENAAEAQIYSMLGAEPQHVDEIRRQTCLPIEQVSATLTMMELKGMVRQVGGMNYVAVRDEPAEYQV